MQDKNLSIDELNEKIIDMFEKIVPALYPKEMIADVVRVHNCIEKIDKHLTKIKLHEEKEYDEILKSFWIYRAVATMSEDMKHDYLIKLEEFSQDKD